MCANVERSQALVNFPLSRVSYSGEMNKNNSRAGFGILYLKNNCKFMGGFQNDKAHGHGTFYDYQAGKRLMAVWENNRIKASD